MPATLLSYQGTENLGDAIQTIAMQRFLETWYDIGSFYYAPRQAMEEGMVVNGWHRNNNEPLPAKAYFAGIHTTSEKLSGISENCLVGCRDSFAHKNALAAQKPAFMMGCVTLTLTRYEGKRHGLMIVDAGPRSTHSQWIAREMPWEEQLELAEKRLRELERASMVFTSRLHVLLPCLAMGTPVMLQLPKGRVYQPERFKAIEINRISGADKEAVVKAARENFEAGARKIFDQSL